MSFLETLSNTVSSGFAKAKNTIASAMSPVTNTLQTALPEIATDQGAQALLSTPSEGSNTMAGGKRRTRRRHRRHRTRRGGTTTNCSIKCGKSADGRHDFGRFINLGDVKERQCIKCRCTETV